MKAPDGRRWQVKAPRKMLACIPQDAATRARLAETTDFVTTPFTGSTPGTCADCGSAVWVGPRQAAVLTQYPDFVIVCLACAVADALRFGGAYGMTLGNPEHREDLPR